MAKTILIIGATSSLGTTLSRELAKTAKKLILASSSNDKLQRLSQDIQTRHSDIELEAITVDFLSQDYLSNFDQMKDCDEIYMLAGYMGNDLFFDPANINAVVQINYTGPATLLSQIIEYAEKSKRSLKAAVITSVAADRGRQSNYIYGAAKAGLDTFLSGLRNKFSAKNIHIMTVRPGFIDTPMTYGMKSPLIAKRHNVAKTIIEALNKDKDILYVPFFWRYIMLIIKMIPEKIFKRLKL